MGGAAGGELGPPRLGGQPDPWRGPGCVPLRAGGRQQEGDAAVHALRICRLHQLGGRRLVPGMPVEAFIQTPSRTVLSYLTRPLADQVGKTFRER